MREKRLRDKTCSSVSSLIALRYLLTTSEGECRRSVSRGDPEDRIFPPGSVKWRNLVVWLARAEGTPAVGAYVCKSARCVYLYDGHIGHRSHPSRVTYVNKHKRRPESLRDSGSTCTSAVLTNCNVIIANLFTCHRIAGNTRRTPRVLNEEILCVRRSSMVPVDVLRRLE